MGLIVQIQAKVLTECLKLVGCSLGLVGWLGSVGSAKEPAIGFVESGWPPGCFDLVWAFLGSFEVVK